MDRKKLLADQAFLSALMDEGEYVANEMDFETEVCNLDRELVVSFNNGWSDFAVVKVADFFFEGRSLDAMDSAEREALTEEELETLAEEPAMARVILPDGQERDYEYPEVEWATFDDAAFERALRRYLQERMDMPQDDETALLTTPGEGHGWALYRGGELFRGSTGADPDFDALLAEAGIGESDYDEYQVLAAWPATAGGFPATLAGVPASAYATQDA